ncbi:UDP-N-acetylenolpyruvoylglucosamine reductase, partial [Haemophilus influenzae]
EIKKHHKNLPHFPQADGSVKLAAGWLIDQCNLKGFQIGGAAVHKKQALVLINKSGATGQDVVKLAHHVRQTVAEKFGVYLQPEVRFISATGEVNSEQIIT